MATTFVCENCGRSKPANIRLKNPQHYCGDKDCQRARKAAWQKEKMAEDPEYHSRQLECLRTWRKERPLDQYQKQYRQEHPDYVRKNRELQRIRNRKHTKQADGQKIVKMDTLKAPSDKSMTYIMNPFRMDASGKIVKMDALIVQLTDLHDTNEKIISQLA
jgi:hypothetical protein